MIYNQADLSRPDHAKASLSGVCYEFAAAVPVEGTFCIYQLAAESYAVLFAARRVTLKEQGYFFRLIVL